MLRYHLWAAGEKALSLIPGGDHIYNAAGRLVAARSGGRYAAYKASFPMTRMGRELIPQGGEVVEVGTGWFHHDAILLWLIGDYRIHLFDISDKARLSYIKRYLRVLRDDIDRLVEELELDRARTLARLDSLLAIERRTEFYRQCNFVPCITHQVDTPFLPERSIDFMVSYCVLGHIRPHILVPELIALRRMLKPEGHFCALIGHDDHWSFHDPSANQFNFYRYSDRTYSKFFETRFEYHNRMVKREWDDLFARVGFEIVEYRGRRTEQSLNEIKKLPHLDARFAPVPKEELAVFHSYYLLRPHFS
jgi:SAM-dependent methyltransferase